MLEQQRQNIVRRLISKSFKVYLTYISKTVEYPVIRWLTALSFGLISIIRIVTLDYLAILYFESLYILYLLVQYFTPAGLPDPDEDNFQLLVEISDLRSFQNDRPILRSINQFTLWKSLTCTFIVSYFCSLFQIFLIPVYWPFLIVYLVILVLVAIQNHTKHMHKYKYKLSDFYGKRQKEAVRQYLTDQIQND